MAREEGKEKVKGKRKRRLNYFYLNGKLHKTLYINRTADTVLAWSYPESKRVGYTWSDVQRMHEKAFTTQEVCRMINRAQRTLETALMAGNIPKPQFTYGLSEVRRKYQFLWCEKDILEAWDYFSTVHRGRPRNDGQVTPQTMPSRRELMAMIRQDEILYVKQGEDFRPVWQAKDF